MKKLNTLSFLSMLVLVLGCSDRSSNGSTASGAGEVSSLFQDSGESNLQAAIQREIRTAKEHARTEIARVKNIVNAQPMTENGIDFDSCTTGGTIAPSGTYTMSCTGLNDSAVCGDTTYEISDGSFDMSLTLPADLADTSAEWLMDMDYSVTVTGGAFSGGTLACDFALTFTLGDDTVEPNCNDFTCTYDDVAISCTDVQSGMSCS